MIKINNEDYKNNFMITTHYSVYNKWAVISHELYGTLVFRSYTNGISHLAHSPELGPAFNDPWPRRCFAVVPAPQQASLHTTITDSSKWQTNNYSINLPSRKYNNKTRTSHQNLHRKVKDNINNYLKFKRFLRRSNRSYNITWQ